MRLRSLQSGVQISPDITINSPLESHRGIATYLASHKKYGHALVHVLPDFDDSAVAPISVLEKAADFYRNVLKIDAECGNYEEFLYFAEMFPLGEYMFEWLERRERVVPKEAIKRVISLLKILTSAHEHGLFHGRITPKSLLLERTGDAFGLRLMGLGVAQAMTESMQFDLDWYDYSFDLEGMDDVAVDAYGVAIVLMGLVCGELGIDSFESSGLLPQPFRNGILQTAMERALSLRIDTYASLLAFSQDLEAALLELDGKEGEMFVGDLVGFESAIRSVTSVTQRPQPELSDSGVWSSLVDNLEGDERSSLLCSLTSLTAIPSTKLDDDDEDVTHVSSLPDAVLGMRRIHSKHSENVTASEKRAKQTRAARGEELGDDESTNRSKGDVGNRTETTVIEKDLNHEDASSHIDEMDASPEKSPSAPAILLSEEVSKKLADIQNLENEADDDEDDDEAPTRIMARPNYFSISGEKNKSQSASSAILEVLDDNKNDELLKKEEKPEDLIAKMVERIRSAQVKTREFEIISGVLYDEEPDEPEQHDASDNKSDDCIKFDKKSSSAENAKIPSHDPTVVAMEPVSRKSSSNNIVSMSKMQVSIIGVAIVIIVMLLAMFIIKMVRG